MKTVFLTLAVLTLSTTTAVYSQCQVDSIVTYRVIAGQREASSAEYFKYENDSVVEFSLVELTSEGAKPVHVTKVTRAKVKKNYVVTHEVSNWNASRASYQLTSVTTLTRNKKGQLISEVHVDKNATGDSKKMISYTYGKEGELLTYDLKQWNNNSQAWMNESHIDYTYQNGLQAESVTYKWDTISNAWMDDWKTVFTYDSTNVLSETVMYQSKNKVWVPYSRTVYGKETEKALEWNIVQEWNGAKSAWSNLYYYVFHQNEKGLTITEVHLEWGGKDWNVNGTYHYVYNESDHLVQILNDKNEVMMERYCRN